MATPPIVFIYPGTPDVKLLVLGISEFHVDSTHLKMRSAFFRKFLDSADKDLPPAGDRFGSASSSAVLFRYEWITQIDEDGKGWSLVEKSKAKPEHTDVSLFQGNANEQAEGFERMLNAMYLLPHSIFGNHELEILTSLADYYCALQVMSRTLVGNLMESSFIYMLPVNLDGPGLESALNSAVTLRNSVLFKDLLVLCVGQWDTDRLFELTNEKVRKLTLARRYRLTQWVTEVHQILLGISATPHKVEVDDSQEDVEKADMTAQAKIYMNETATKLYQESEDGEISVPQYFRRLWEICDDDNEFPFRGICEGLSHLMENHLVLLPGVKGGDSQGVFKGHFLGARVDDISDADLPWDTTQTDW